MPTSQSVHIDSALSRFSVGVLDAGGNEIVRFGRYGNIDEPARNGVGGSPKAASGTPQSGIPFAWPTGVSVAGDRAYVLDRINRRIVVVRLGCRAEESCAVN